jgi:glycosyltransferase involved in cell wall biosynthesis
MARILIMTGYYYPHIGGSVVHIHEIAKRLVKLGHTVDIVTLNSEKTLGHEAMEGVTIYRLPSFSVLAGNYEIILPGVTFFRVVYALLKKKNDIVLTYTRFHTTTLLGLLISKVMRIPHIHTELGSSHSVLANRIVCLLSEWYDHTLGALAIKYADQVICNCKASKDFLLHLGVEGQRIKVINSGVDLNLFSRKGSNWKSKLGLDEDTVVITVISRLIYAKGVQDVIYAFPRIKQEVKNAKLLIVGDGNYRRCLESIVPDTNREDIIFLGELSRKDVSDIYNITDIIINPSYSESLISYSVLEAGAIGVPSISTDVGGAREVIKEGISGMLFEPKNIAELNEKVYKLLLNPELRKSIGANIQQIIIHDYDWDKITFEHETLIHLAVSSRKPRAPPFRHPDINVWGKTPSRLSPPESSVSQEPNK